MLHHKGEMRHLILIAALMLILALICAGSEIYLNLSCASLIRELEKVENAQDLEKFDKTFDRITDGWLLLLSHDETDRLSEVYFHMFSCPQEEFEQEKQVLLHFLRLIPDRTRLSLQNIL